MAKGLSFDDMMRRIEEATVPAAASFGLALWGVELETSGRPLARIFVDAPASGDAPLIGAETSDSGLELDAAENVQEDATQEIMEDAMDLVGGVSIDECAEISRMVGLALDVDDVFPDAWILEVSSPGMDRQFFSLEQMTPYAGQLVEAVLREPSREFGGRRRFRGELREVNIAGGNIVIRVERAPSAEDDDSPADALNTADAALNWQDMRKVRLVPVFPDTSKPRPGKKRAQGGGKHES